MVKRAFDVSVSRDGRWWVFDIPELGTGGQARSLDEVDFEAQGLAAMWIDVAPEDVAVKVSVVGEAGTLTAWEAAERDEAAARNAQAQAAARRRAIVRELRSRGYSAPDTGRLLGISRQRVYQLERSSSQKLA